MKPIIFIPGTQATSLVDSNTFDFNMIWNAYDTLGNAISTKITGPYIEDKLTMSGLYDERISSLIERNHIARMPYEKTFVNLAAKLKENKDTSPIFLFGYDWRLSNAENGKRLKKFTEILKAKIAETPKATFEGFRFVTHSMGAFVLSCYLKDKATYADIDRILFTAPPFQGSPYPLVHMVKGDGGFKSFLNSIFGRNEDIRKVVRTYPSVFELLSTYDGSLVFEDDQTPVNLLKIENWQSNVPDDIPDLFAQRLTDLKKFWSNDMADLSLLPADLRSRIVIAAGSDDKTLAGLQVRRKEGAIKNFVIIDEKDKLKYDSGDGTVPLVSAICYKDSIKTLLVPKLGVLHEVSDNVDYHGLFLRDSRVQNILFRFMNEKLGAVALESKGTLTALKGKNADWWKSAVDNVVNASPF
jgi:hypothetical protein